MPYLVTKRPRRIQIQANRGTQSGANGEIVSSWVTIASAWTISWESGGGTLARIANEPRSEDTAIIRIRYRPDITITPRLHQIVCNGRTYGLTAAIDVNDQHQFIDLYVREPV